MKVKYVPFQPHCFAYGGFEIQMLSTLEASIKSGVDAQKIDIWSRDNDFDILHCWGLGFHHYENIRWAKNGGKKVVLTALLSYYETFNERIRQFFSTYIKKAQYYIQIANMADVIVVVNELQAEACLKYFKVPSRRIHVVPNIVHPKYFENKIDFSFPTKYNVSNYVLVVGSVCARKNQLNLIKACIKKNMKLVIIGRLLEGEDAYGKQIEQAIDGNSNITWIKGLKANSDELISAYQGSSLVALPSYVEQQPITLLEAVAVQKPLLIANRAFSKQKYYLNAKCIEPESVESIEEGLLSIISEPSKYVPSLLTMDECREENVGNMYHQLYKKVLKN